MAIQMSELKERLGLTEAANRFEVLQALYFRITNLPPDTSAQEMIKVVVALRLGQPPSASIDAVLDAYLSELPWELPAGLEEMRVAVRIRLHLSEATTGLQLITAVCRNRLLLPPDSTDEDVLEAAILADLQVSSEEGDDDDEIIGEAGLTRLGRSPTAASRENPDEME